MSELQFDVDKEVGSLRKSLVIDEDKNFSLIKFLLKINLVKDKRQANIFLIIIIILMIFVSMFIFSNISSGRKLKYSEEELKYIDSLSFDKKTSQQYDSSLFPN